MKMMKRMVAWLRGFHNNALSLKGRMPLFREGRSPISGTEADNVHYENPRLEHEIPSEAGHVGRMTPAGQIWEQHNLEEFEFLKAFQCRYYMEGATVDDLIQGQMAIDHRTLQALHGLPADAQRNLLIRMLQCNLGLLSSVRFRDTLVALDSDERAREVRQKETYRCGGGRVPPESMFRIQS